MPAGAGGGERSRLPAARQHRYRHDRGAQRPRRHRRRQDRRLPADPVHGRCGQKAIQVRYSYDQPGTAAAPTAICKRPASTNTLDMGVYQPKADSSAPIWEQSRPPRLERQRGQEPGDRRERLQRRADLQRRQPTKAFVDGRTTRAYQPGPIQAGAVGGRARHRLRRARLGRRRDGIHYHVQVLQSNDPTWSNDAYAPSGPPADVGQLDPRLVHRRPARPRRDGAGQRDHEPRRSMPRSAPAAPGSTSSPSSTTTTTSPTTT